MRYKKKYLKIISYYSNLWQKLCIENITKNTKIKTKFSI